jgi:AcrR family transcriptional regulator
MTEARAPGSASRTRLSREVIIQAGLELGARADTASISVRNIGALLGADPTAVYRYFPSKQALMEALLDEVLSRVLARVDFSADWRSRLLDLATGTLIEFVAFPSIAIEATVLTTNGPAETDTIECILSAFAEAGLAGDPLVQHYAFYASYVLSGAAGIARGRSDHPDPLAHASPWLEGPLLVDPTRQPHLAAVASELQALQDQDIFRFGVEAIISSAERAARP